MYSQEPRSLNIKDRILGGEQVASEEFPWMVFSYLIYM